MSRRSFFSIAIAGSSVVALAAATLAAVPASAATTNELLVEDSFSRTVAQGFGAASTGGSYTTPEPKNMSVNGSQGVLSLTQTMTRSAWVGPSSAEDVDVTNSFGVTALPTAGSVYQGQMVRTTAAGAYYTSRLRIMPDKTIYLGLRAVAAGGSQTTIGSDVTLPFAMAAGTRLISRFQVQGSTLRVKAWAKGSTEPANWQLTGTSTALPNAGRTGVWSYLGGGTNSLDVTVDDLRVESLTPANVLPIAAFTTSVNNLALAVDASGSADSDGTISSYAWDFGDGTTGTGKTATKTYAAAGTYPVKLTVTDNRGGTATITKQVSALAQNVLPTASFTSSVNDLALAVDAGGSADSDGAISSYAWDFGDGTSGTGKTATKTYAAPGPYSVKLTVTDNRGGTATVTNQVTAIAPNVLPTAAFTSSVNDLALAVDAGGSADSDGTISSYAWDFGDGTTGTGKTATKTYAAPGPYSVKLTVTDNRGGKATVTNQVTAIAPNVLPTAAFTSSVNDLALAVDAGGSTDSDGTLTDYAWDFGDGTTGTGKTATKTYATPGPYSVKLTVTDNRGGKATVTNQVTAIAPNVLPTAAFTEFVSDLSVILDAGGSSDSDGTLTDYAWDFGDGTTGTGKTVSKIYPTPGLRTVKLTVTDNRGGKATVSRDVTAIAPNVLPTAAFTTSVNDLALAVDAGGSADPDGTLTDYAWDFGDGTSGTGKTATKTYAAPGPYSVKLTVTDNRGGKATVTNQVTAIAPNVLPTAAFTSSVNDLALAVDAGGSSDSDGTLTDYAWDFGDGTSGTGKTATKTYAAAGPYSVKLTVTDNRGGKATVTNQVTAIAPNVLPTAAFTSSVIDLALAVDAGGSADPDGTLTDYAWDFGDGTSGTGKTATKTYAAPGPYSVKLTVTDNRGGKATVTNQVTAIAPNVLPTAAFTTSVNDLALAVDAGGSADPDGALTDYAWDFGDGTTGTGKTATKTYAAAGPYSVKLTVTDNRGGKATLTKSVNAIAPNVLPTAAFTTSVANLAATADASTSSDPDGTIASYAWDFGDGTSGTGKTASKTYSAAGTFSVKLTVTDNRGGTASVTKQITTTTPAPVRPDATNTGVPAGTALTVYNGDMTITTAGAVIDGLDIRGYVVVKAPNVTIKRSIIRGGAAPTVGKGLLSIVTAGATNFLVEDVTVVPANPNPYINGINVNQPGTFRRVDISGSVDGMMIYGSGINVMNSYIHDLTHYLSDPNWGGGPSHDDSIQIQAGTGIKITNNTLKGAYNSAVMITQDAGVTKDLWINNNWIDGGGCSLNYGSAGAYKTGMQANNNRFGRAQRVAGCAIIHNAAMSDLVPTGNVWDDNGQPAGIKKGA